jgi:hypothetical protein
MRTLLLALLLTATLAAEDSSDEKAPIPAAARSAIATYEAELAKAQADYDKREAAAIKVAMAALEKSMTAETKAGNLDSALAIREYLKGLSEKSMATTDVLGNRIDSISLTKLPMKKANAPYAPIGTSYGDPGTPVKLNGRDCKTYIFAHATSTVSFDIPRGFRRFKATGVKAIPNASGSWKYIVVIDGKQAFESGELGNQELPISVNIPVGSREIELRIDCIGNDGMDHAIWAEPVFER